MGSYYLIGTKFPFYKIYKRVLGMDGGEGCTAV